MSSVPKAARAARRKVKKTGKGALHSFIGIPHYILKSEQFGTLSPHAVKLLMELAKEYKGTNNGDFSAAFSVLSSRGWKSSATLSRAIKELLSTGWIVTTRHGGRTHCSLYGVTWWPLDHCSGKLELAAENVARHDWKNCVLQSDGVPTHSTMKHKLAKT